MLRQRLISPSPCCLIYTKKEEVEIRHVPSYYDKNQLYSLESTQLVFFDQIYIQQINGPPTTSWLNEYKVSFPRDKDGKVDVENSIYDMNYRQKKQRFIIRRKEDSVLA